MLSAQRMQGREGLHRRLFRKPGWFVAGTAIAATVALGGITPTHASSDTITAVMNSGLRVLDPIVTTAHITRDHGYMIYDVLIAQDKDFRPQPQMAEWTVSDDRLVYTFTLREGLKFHDGTPVTAADAVASLKRWGKRDGGGQMLFEATESIVASGQKTITWKLKTPFAALLEVLSKQSALPAFIMPERVANTPANQPIKEYIGSGPFKFVESEFQPGINVTYEKFDDYVPRKEAPNWMAGGKVVNVKRVKWVTMPDAQTTLNALISGEIDYVELVQTDLLPVLEGNPDITVEKRDEYGYQSLGRMNFKHPPFDNVKVRQAALKALKQFDVLATLIGNPEYYKVCGAIFGCGTPLADETGTETLTGNGDPEGAKKLLREAGYDGKPIVLMQATDVPSIAVPSAVAAQALRNVGFKVDMQAMDFQTMVTRRASMKPPAEGGWNMFFANFQIPDIDSPLASPMLNGRQDQAWFGWPNDPELEKLRAEFAAATSPEAQKEVGKRIQAHTLENAIYIPLGQWNNPQARAKTLTGMIPSPVPVFWNIKKAE